MLCHQFISSYKSHRQHIMGKRTSSELEEEVEVEETEKKSKKEKKEKKDKKRARDEPEPEPVTVAEKAVAETKEDDTTPATTDRKKITEDDFEAKKVLFAKWLKDEKDIVLKDLSAEDASEKFKKFVKKYNKNKLAEEYYVEEVKPKWAPAPTTGDVSILLFYAYCPVTMTRSEQDAAIAFCYKTLNGLGMTGRLRIAREGYNSTLTGTYKTVRQFTDALRVFHPPTFGKTDFKYVDNLPENQMLKGLKVWPVTEIVTYGFTTQEAPINTRGTHLSPVEFHQAMLDPNTVVIDVRNFNETVIGKFAPAAVALEAGETNVGATVLDPCMRRSTEFPQWIKDHRDELKDKKVLMYCTAGVRCERASSFLIHQGIENVFQLDGGIHRYLEAFPDDGGFWVGKNYTFDKRFNHGAKTSVTISHCVHCDLPWDRYQAQRKCGKCSMEVILCKECQKIKPNIPTAKLRCPLCKEDNSKKGKNYNKPYVPEKATTGANVGAKNADSEFF